MRELSQGIESIILQIIESKFVALHHAKVTRIA